MSHKISESDWKIFRALHAIALERFCQQTLVALENLISDTTKTGHSRYLSIYEWVRKRDKEMAVLFDDLRRSTALQQLAIIQSHKLLTDEEILRFSAETRAVLEFFAGNLYQ